MKDEVELLTVQGTGATARGGFGRARRAAPSAVSDGDRRSSSIDTDGRARRIGESGARHRRLRGGEGTRRPGCGLRRPHRVRKLGAAASHRVFGSGFPGGGARNPAGGRRNGRPQAHPHPDGGDPATAPTTWWWGDPSATPPTRRRARRAFADDIARGDGAGGGAGRGPERDRPSTGRRAIAGPGRSCPSTRSGTRLDLGRHPDARVARDPARERWCARVARIKEAKGSEPAGGRTRGVDVRPQADPVPGARARLRLRGRAGLSHEVWHSKQIECDELGRDTFLDTESGAPLETLHKRSSSRSPFDRSAALRTSTAAASDADAVSSHTSTASSSGSTRPPEEAPDRSPGPRSRLREPARWRNSSSQGSIGCAVSTSRRP